MFAFRYDCLDSSDVSPQSQCLSYDNINTTKWHLIRLTPVGKGINEIGPINYTRHIELINFRKNSVRVDAVELWNNKTSAVPSLVHHRYDFLTRRGALLTFHHNGSAWLCWPSSSLVRIWWRTRISKTDRQSRDVCSTCPSLRTHRRRCISRHCAPCRTTSSPGSSSGSPGPFGSCHTQLK